MKIIVRLQIIESSAPNTQETNSTGSQHEMIKMKDIKTWVTPKIVVVVKEEKGGSVLTNCKHDGVGGGSESANNTCQTYSAPPCTGYCVSTELS